MGNRLNGKAKKHHFRQAQMARADGIISTRALDAPTSTMATKARRKSFSTFHQNPSSFDNGQKIGVSDKVLSHNELWGLRLEADLAAQKQAKARSL
ncbi:hypothetical protein KKF81_01865 [Candidatus Micrarchaeota archaeon]|nr:hypothetical protein [Candidatus Micrarchaeota archaeon]MBU1165666.1 hypothetical protein [Candidatus Micrarchaeota archaeon]MBU1887474.1 hypothetical protein [Candidatus Micrarchaeota archaeon]